MKLSEHPRCPLGPERQPVWFAQRLANRWRAPARGFTLIEVLVGCALVAILGLAIGGILFALIGSERLYLAQTDRYESLRLPATLIVQDARYARFVVFSNTMLTLYLDEAQSDYIEYKFEKVGSGSAMPSPYRLRREVNIGGVSTVEYVSDDLAVATSTKSRFTCNLDPPDRKCTFVLVRRAPSTGGQELRYQGTALLR